MQQGICARGRPAATNGTRQPGWFTRGDASVRVRRSGRNGPAFYGLLRTAPNLDPYGPSPSAQADAELGYGPRALNGYGIFTPYARASLSEAHAKSLHLGTRLALTEELDIRLEATYRHQEQSPSAKELALLATMPW